MMSHRKIGDFTEDVMRKAVDNVLLGEVSIRKAAEKYNLKFQTLARYVKKRKADLDTDIRMCPNYAVNQIFSTAEETELVSYITQPSSIGFGLTPDGVRKLAFQAGVTNQIVMPENWSKERKAGKKWFTNFRKRNPELSIRSPENCSLARASAFNKHTMQEFFDKLESVYLRYPQFREDENLISNLDETSTTTVSKSPKVVAIKGVHQVNQITSSERGILTTTCCFINAGGNTIPPVMIFPRKNVKPYMTKGAPTGSKALCSSSGWMTDELFVDVMAHFIQCTKASKENPMFLLYDNHSSHISLQATQLAKENGVVILTIPPRISHRVQPLDVGVYSSFKNYYGIAQKRWTDAHPGQTITLADIPEFVAFAHEHSMTKSKFTAGFKKTGIFPCNRFTFTDNDYAPNDVMDRPNPQVEPVSVFITSAVVTPSSSAKSTVENIQITPDDTHTASMTSVDVPQIALMKSSDDIRTTNSLTSASISPSTSQFISPFEFRGIPKAGARKKSNRGRKPKTSTIVTDTPEQDRLKSEYASKLKKLRQKAKHRRVNFSEEDETEEEDEPMRINHIGKKCSALTEDSSDGISELSVSGNDSGGETENESEEEIEREKSIGDFVLTKFLNNQKGKGVHYVGRITKLSKGKVKVNFLKRGKNAWVYPNVEDHEWIDLDKIIRILPNNLMPNGNKPTKRQLSFIKFDSKTEKMLDLYIK